DMMSFYGRREMFWLYPIECSDAVQRVNSIGQELDLKREPDGIDKYGHFFRSDHFTFNAREVPTFTIGLGGKYLTMSEDEIAEIRKQVGQLYHQPNDEVYSWFRYDGVLQELKVLYHLGSFYANQGEKPNFKPENPYNAAKRIIRIKQVKGIY
ncbi:MAG: M28 family peptidase, partial [Candidatus Aminicenantes bacterium]